MARRWRGQTERRRTPVRGPVRVAGWWIPAVLALAACTQSSGSAGPVTTTVTSTVSSSGASSTRETPNPTASASAAALDVYRRYWAARVAAQADPTQPPPKELSVYAIDTAQANELAAMITYRQQGIAWRGQPVLSPVVATVVLSDPPKVTIRDCVDTASWIPVLATTGKSARAPDQLVRVVGESVATVYMGRWVIRTSTAFRDRAC